MFVFHHKGYEAAVTFDETAKVFHGEITNLRDVITFQGTSPESLRQALADSVEDYLALCAARGEKPEVPVSFSSFESCLAYFKVNPPEGCTMDVELPSEEARFIRDQAALHECTVDIFIGAIIAWEFAQKRAV